MLRLRTAIILSTVSCLSCLLGGCNSGDRPIPPPSPANQNPRPFASAGGGGGAAAVDLKPLEAKYDAAKKAFDKAKNDAKAKSEYVDAANKLGDANLNADALPPKVKYPNALKYYREVLKVDPKNQNAKNNADLIVAIYKQMGRPVPGGG